MAQAAAVIDLEEFRRRQAMREAPRPAMTLRRTPPVVPFWVVWIPVWPVA